MTKTFEQLPTIASGDGDGFGRVVGAWVGYLEAAFASKNAGEIEELFQDDATFRDLLALGWDFRNAVGGQAIGTLVAGSDSTPPTSIRARPDAQVFHEADRRSLWTFLVFSTADGAGDGYVRLARQSNGAWRATALVLSLTDLDSHPLNVGALRPDGRTHGPIPDRVGWRESLDHEFEHSEPPVVILGAGHNGLILAARLRALGVRSLIIEPNARVGDNWRKRYTSLALHTPLTADEFPYLPYPATWPHFSPKDKLADFLESYASLLDLSVWTDSRAENIHFNEVTQRWSLDVVHPDGSRRKLTPGHLVLATGNNAEAIRPQLPGSEKFAGTVMHAVDYRGWKDWVGRKAVVVGTGVSGHDIAQDLVEHGVDVTLIQRSGTVVLNTSTVHATLFANHTSGKYTAEEADLINASTPFGQLPSQGPAQVAVAKDMDRELLDGLEKAGFVLSDGPEGQGALGLIYGENTTGYYYNVGASELIANGEITLRHGSVTGFTKSGVTLDDGGTVDADLVVFATGYRGVPTTLRSLLGAEIAEELGSAAEVGVDGEFGRLWRRSGRERLWLMYSLSIGDSRFYSRLLALQIAAAEAGTLPAPER